MTAPLSTLRAKRERPHRPVHRAPELPDWDRELHAELEAEHHAHEQQAYDDELDGARRFEGDRW